MSKERMKNITVDADFLDVCLWSSARYFVGRRTIAANCHAGDIARLLVKNKQFMDADRRKFLAADIRRSITDTIRFHPNINIQGMSDDVDALTLLCREIEKIVRENNLIITLKDWTEGMVEEEGTFNPNCYIWHINLGTKQVERNYIREAIKSVRKVLNLSQDLSDLVPWIKLAGCLDPHDQVTYDPSKADDSKPSEHTELMFGYPVYGQYLDEQSPHFFMGYCTPEEGAANLSMDTYLLPEIIKNVKHV